MNRDVKDPQPLLFFAWLGIGMLSLLLSIVWLLITPEILIGLPTLAPKVIAWTHLMILGWLCSLFFAAGYQLTPVVTLNPLASRWLSRVHGFLHGLGVTLMVFSFATSRYHLLAVGGTSVVSGFVLFALNVLLSAGLDPKWNHLSLMWITGIFWLLVGATMAIIAVCMRVGVMIGVNFNEIVGLHIHTMIGGFFLMLLMAAASKLVPMFMLSPEQPQYGSWIAGVVLNLALLGTYWGFHSPVGHYRSVLMIVVLAVVIAYYAQLFYFAKTKRRKWDAGITLFYVANLTLIPAWWLLFQYHSGSLEQTGDQTYMIRSAVFIFTFLTFNGCILGMAQKIVPFMLWHHLYSKHLGKAKVPLTTDLLNTWSLWPIVVSYLAAAVLYLLALFYHLAELIRPATIAMLIAFVFVVCNAPKFISHWKQPKLTPFLKH